jgi:hypothetical protein
MGESLVQLAHHMADTALPVSSNDIIGLTFGLVSAVLAIIMVGITLRPRPLQGSFISCFV